MKLTWWKVFLNGKTIDKVPHTSDQDAGEVRDSLVNYDGYDPSITVKKGRGKRS